MGILDTISSITGGIPGLSYPWIISENPKVVTPGKSPWNILGDYLKRKLEKKEPGVMNPGTPGGSNNGGNNNPPTGSPPKDVKVDPEYLTNWDTTKFYSFLIYLLLGIVIIAALVALMAQTQTGQTIIKDAALAG
jgi:hypothetical protein